ncbi:MAG: hypothetical protein WD225_07280 [Ilumatobacteraceae bacterium]
MALQARFEPSETEARPGESITLLLTVENLGDTTESATITASGLTAPWTTVTRPNVTLFGGSHDTVEVVVRPPAVHTTSAGATTLAVRVLPLVDPDDTVTAEATLFVQPFDDRRINLLQPLQRARGRATFELMVENHGNSLASCRLHLVDPSNRVDGTFDPPAVGVAPGGSSLVRLRLRSTSIMFRRRDRQLDFEIEATQSDHEPAVARAALIQPPTIPGRVLGGIAVVGALVGAAAAAWFGVVRPELRDAAERAVDERVAELSAVGDNVTPSDDGDEPDGAGEAQDADAALDDGPIGIGESDADEGEPFATRLSLRTSVGGTNSDSATVPDDARLLLTDVVLQNPHADLGTASLLRDDEILYEWDLGQMSAANEFQPRLTPLPFGAGSEIVFRSSCEGAGSPDATGCEVAVLLAGRLVEVAQPNP